MLLRHAFFDHASTFHLLLYTAFCSMPPSALCRLLLYIFSCMFFYALHVVCYKFPWLFHGSCSFFHACTFTPSVRYFLYIYPHSSLGVVYCTFGTHPTLYPTKPRQRICLQAPMFCRTSIAYACAPTCTVLHDRFSPYKKRYSHLLDGSLLLFHQHPSRQQLSTTFHSHSSSYMLRS